jgi:4-carboxymuconolactone decarboxylase
MAERFGARIPMADDGALAPRQREVLDLILSGPRGKSVGPLRAALHNPDLAEQWQGLGRVLRFEISLPKRARELAILLVGRRWNCNLEFHLHTAEAREAGIDPDIVDAIRRCALPTLPSPADRDVYRYTRLLLLDGKVDDTAHAAIVARWGVPGVVELTALVGYYSMVALMLNAHRMEPDPPTVPLEPVSGLAELPALGEERT